MRHYNYGKNNSQCPGRNSRTPINRISLIDFIQELDMTDKGNVIDKAILCLANKMKLLEKEEIEVAMENDLL